VGVIIIGGCSDSGLITFVPHPAFLRIPTTVIPSFHLVSSHSNIPMIPPPFSIRPMLRTHPPHALPSSTYYVFFAISPLVPRSPRLLLFSSSSAIVPAMATCLACRDTPPLISISTFAYLLPPRHDTSSFLCILYRGSLSLDVFSILRLETRTFIFFVCV
jgi:hypothetical protein